jgi:hypothetical protein
MSGKFDDGNYSEGAIASIDCEKINQPFAFSTKPLLENV